MSAARQSPGSVNLSPDLQPAIRPNPPPIVAKPETKEMSVLSQKAMLSHVRLSAWSARRIDRKATEEINEKNNAANDAGRYNKLLVDSKALAGIQSAISAARAFHYSRTLPWQIGRAHV